MIKRVKAGLLQTTVNKRDVNSNTWKRGVSKFLTEHSQHHGYLLGLPVYWAGSSGQETTLGPVASFGWRAGG